MGEGLKRARAAARATRKPTAAQLRDAVIEECAKAVPTSWMDSMLSGPKAVRGEFDGPSTESLLHAVAERIRGLKDHQ